MNKQEITLIISSLFIVVIIIFVILIAIGIIKFGSSSTSKPGSTTSKPGTITSKPGSTTSKPGSTTSKPGTITSKPGSTTSKPGTKLNNFFPSNVSTIPTKKCKLITSNGSTIDCLTAYNYSEYKGNYLGKDSIKPADDYLGKIDTTIWKKCKSHTDENCYLDYGDPLTMPDLICHNSKCWPRGRQMDQNNNIMINNFLYNEMYNKECNSTDDCEKNYQLNTNLFSCRTPDPDINDCTKKNTKEICNLYGSCKWDDKKNNCTANTNACALGQKCPGNIDCPSSLKCPQQTYNTSKKVCLPNLQCKKEGEVCKLPTPSETINGKFSTLSGNISNAVVNPYANTFQNPYSICGNITQPLAKVLPRWNWIIGTCIGESCGNPSNNDNFKEFPTKWTKGKNIGSKIKVNYVGSYQYNTSSKQWDLQKDSSFNTDGKLPAIDLMDTKANYKNWFMPGPLPGGSANWGEGFYPAGAQGVSAPAMGFILSVDYIFNVAWYILNQQSLDRGPAGTRSDMISTLNPQPGENPTIGNSWASARSGEWDLLESPMFCDKNRPELGLKPCPNQTKDPDYRFLYSNTSINEGSNGISLHHGKGIGNYPNQSGSKTGWFDSKKYFIADDPDKIDNSYSNPRVFFAVIDKNGTTIFEIPTGGADDGKYWTGITQKTCPDKLQGTFNKKYTPIVTMDTYTSGNPSVNNRKFKASFLPSCPLTVEINAQSKSTTSQFNKFDVCKYGCSPHGIDSGICGNYIYDKMISTNNIWGTIKHPYKDKSNKLIDWNLDMQTPHEPDKIPQIEKDNLCTCNDMQVFYQGSHKVPDLTDKICPIDSPFMCVDPNADSIGGCFSSSQGIPTNCKKWCKYHWIDKNTNEIYSYNKPTQTSGSTTKPPTGSTTKPPTGTTTKPPSGSTTTTTGSTTKIPNYSLCPKTTNLPYLCGTFDAGGNYYNCYDKAQGNCSAVSKNQCNDPNGQNGPWCGGPELTKKPSTSQTITPEQLQKLCNDKKSNCYTPIKGGGQMQCYDPKNKVCNAVTNDKCNTPLLWCPNKT